MSVRQDARGLWRPLWCRRMSGPRTSGSETQTRTVSRSHKEGGPGFNIEAFTRLSPTSIRVPAEASIRRLGHAIVVVEAPIADEGGGV